MDEASARRFLVLAIAYSFSITSAAVGLYFYVVIPLWFWFALSSTRFDSSQSLRKARRFLVLSLVLWIAFIIPLFFFILVFSPLIYAAEVSAILIGSTLMYLAANSSASGSPRIATARRAGLAAGVATAVILLIAGALLALAIARTVPFAEMLGVLPMLSIGALIPAMISALSFVGIAVWTRKRVLEDTEP